MRQKHISHAGPPTATILTLYQAFKKHRQKIRNQKKEIRNTFLMHNAQFSNSNSNYQTKVAGEKNYFSWEVAILFLQISLVPADTYNLGSKSQVQLDCSPYTFRQISDFHLWYHWIIINVYLCKAFWRLTQSKECKRGFEQLFNWTICKVYLCWKHC